MTTLFLSHSSRDKHRVRQLVRDLVKAGVKVWFDEDKIQIGAEIVDEIQEGIVKSDFVAIWLTCNAIKSGWVKREWQAKYLDEVSGEAPLILPLLAEDCELPPFLKQKQFADFRTNYKDGLRQLLRSLHCHSFPDVDVTKGVLTYLDDLVDAKIDIPLQSPIQILQTLKSLARTGKQLRLSKRFPNIEIRSVYDHILSIAHSADCFFSSLSHNLDMRDIDALSRFIAYHDMCEVLVGDIPVYTNVEDYGKMFCPRLTENQKQDREKAANQFLLAFLKEKHRDDLNAVVSTSKKSHVFKFFLILDKIDPIVAVWRYLHFYRDKLGDDAESFLWCLRDFFKNPKVKSICEKNIMDHRVAELILTLQDQEAALKYYRDQSHLVEIAERSGLDEHVVQNLIEGRQFEFVATIPDRRAVVGLEQQA